MTTPGIPLRHRPTRGRLLVGCAAALLLMTACSGDSDDPGPTTTTTSPSTSTSTSAPADTTTTTEAAEGEDSGDDGSDEAPSTTVSADGAGEGDELDCAWPGDPVTSGGFPSYSAGDSLLVDTRLAGHGTYDRFVLELDGDAGVPSDSYVVSWTATPPAAEGSGEPVAPAGDWYLEIRVAASMYDFDTDTAYDGPTSLMAGDTGNVNQALSGGSFEGYMLWVLGADHPRGFQVFELSSPSRIVIDVCVGGVDWEAEPAASPCPPLPALPAEAVVGSDADIDLDGDGVAEYAYTYFVPSESKWHIRVESASATFDDQISDSDGVFEARPLGGLQMNEQAGDELFLQIAGGAYTRSIGVYTLDDCDLVRTTLAGSGTPADWYEGASVSNVVSIECHPGTHRITQHSASIAGFDGDGDPVGWDTTHDVLELSGSVWSPRPGPPPQGIPGATPPFSAELDCPLG